MAGSYKMVVPITSLSAASHVSYLTAGFGAGELERERERDARDSGRSSTDLLLTLVIVSNLS